LSTRRALISTLPPVYPPTFDIRVGAGDGGARGCHPVADYFFVFEE